MKVRRILFFILFVISLSGFLYIRLGKNKNRNTYETALDQNMRATKLKENLILNSKVEFLKDEFNHQIPANQNFLMFIYKKFDCDICIKKLFESVEYFKKNISLFIPDKLSHRSGPN